MADKTETIMVAILAALSNIDGTGNYNTNLSTASRTLKHWATMKESEFPAAFCLFGDENFEPFAMTQGAGSTIKSDFTILIRGFLHKDDGDLETQITNLRQDFLRAILTDETQNSIAIETRPLTSAVMEGWDANEFKVAILDMSFLVRFSFDSRSP